MIPVSARASLAGTLAALILSACTLEQILIGQWYDIQTPRAGACPMRTQLVQSLGHVYVTLCARRPAFMHVRGGQAAPRLITGRFSQ